MTPKNILQIRAADVRIGGKLGKKLRRKLKAALKAKTVTAARIALGMAAVALDKAAFVAAVR